MSDQLDLLSLPEMSELGASVGTASSPPGGSTDAQSSTLAPSPDASFAVPPTTSSTSLTEAGWRPANFVEAIGLKWRLRCPACSVLFERYASTLVANHRRQDDVCCSRACRVELNDAWLSLACQGCGTTFRRRRGDAEKARRAGFVGAYCAKTCWNRHTAQEARARSAPVEPMATAASLIVQDATIRTETGRRCYYDPAAIPTGYCHSCGERVKGKATLTCKSCLLAARASTWLTVPCSYCGVDFRLMRAEHEKKIRRGQVNRYCSSACVGEAHARRGATSCAACSAPIVRARGTRFCSEACRRLSRTAARTRAGQRVLAEKTCQSCGESFRPRSSRTTYCSRRCADDAHSLRQTGAGNAHFKDGTSYAEWFKRMRPLIVERDGCCRACGVIPEPQTFTRNGRPATRSLLIVHHIDEQPWNNVPANLIALCQSCHIVHHKSRQTPWPWFGEYAEQASLSMTYKWIETTTSLQRKYSSTTA